MRDFVRKLNGLSYKTWLARNLTKHHKTKGMIAVKTKEELMKEADKIAQQCLLNIKKKYNWLLDIESAAYTKMGYTEVQHSIFELEALQVGASEINSEVDKWEDYELE